jgi:tetratricopeptide (TPR) repeat protein
MVFEDAHWADPTSLELLTLAIERLQTLPILLIITLRPDFQPPWAGQPHVTSVALNRLSQRARTALVEHIAGGKALPAALLAQIVERTDGVPLFVEELTKAVLESEQLHEGHDSYVLEQPMQQLSIPTTLQASLMARVDRLGSAREVLQIGSAIGREFSYGVLAAVAGLPDAVLQDALIRLIEAELLFLRGTPPNAVYSFKHGLVQDTAYSAMLRARRQQLHSAIALVMEKRHPEIAETTPEVLAQQFEQAGHSEKAIEYWYRAGERDLRRFAMKESIAHYESALRLALTLPEPADRERLELSVRLRLGIAQQIAFGPAAKEPMQNYERAMVLSQNQPDRGRERFLATWGVWFHETMTGRTAEAFQRSDDLIAIARELDDPSLLLEAFHARAPMALRAGDLSAIREAAKEVMRLYDRDRHRDHAYYFGGHDARVCAQSFYAIGLWGEGLLEQAQRMARQCVADARDLGHTFSLAHSLNMTCLTHVLLNDVDACQQIADELYPLAERNKFPWPLAAAQFNRGWVLAKKKDLEEGIALMLKASDHPSSDVLKPVLLTLVAEQQLVASRLGDALATLQRGLEHSKLVFNQFYAPEILRVRGEVLLVQSHGNGRAAEQAFREALALAAKQLCRPLELRAAVSLARLLTADGRGEEARDRLAPIYAGFTEGFEKPDLVEAKALLDALR